jgi:two-component system chemotaxis response regulator CheY
MAERCAVAAPCGLRCRQVKQGRAGHPVAVVDETLTGRAADGGPQTPRTLNRMFNRTRVPSGPVEWARCKARGSLFDHGDGGRSASGRRERRRRGTMAVDLSMPILVVDDYNTMVRIIRNLLRQLGFADIDHASDGASALDKMQQKQYGLVISDWNMEPMTGIELLKQVRADPTLRAVPFIMITAESKTENVIAAKKAGVNNYIVKPFNADTLRIKIEAVFSV